MRSRVAEINQNAITHILGDKAVEAPDDICGGAVIRGDDLAQILGVERRRERRRADESQNITVSCRPSASACVP